jgi:hypothetical protein
MTTPARATTQRLGNMVWDLLAAAEDRIDPDSAEAIDARETALAAIGVKGDDAVTVAGRELGYCLMEHLQGMRKLDSLKQASEAYEKVRIKA